MSGSLEFRQNFDWSRLDLSDQKIETALTIGALKVLEESERLVPKRSGRLAGAGRIVSSRGGSKTVAIVYGGPYARWIHEHLHFKHTAGGQAKFLEQALMVKGRDAMNEAGRHLL